MGGKTTTKQSSTQEQNPWAPTIEPLKQGTNILNAHLKDPNANQVYGGQRVAGLDQMTNQGLGMFGAGIGNQSIDYLRDVVGGKYLSAGNPYVSQVQDAVRSSVTPSINATFSNSGLTGSSQHQGILARGLSEGIAQPLFANYENERNRQMQSAGGLASLEQQNAENMIRGGGLRQAQNQAELDAQRMQFEEERTKGLRGFQDVYPMLSQIAGMGGTSTTNSKSTQSQQPNGLAIAGGLGALGLGLATGGAGFGALGGLGGLGGLGSLFGGMGGMGGVSPTSYFGGQSAGTGGVMGYSPNPTTYGYNYFGGPR